jgi:uncharacterized repeat protein (TIGR01451 family)
LIHTEDPPTATSAEPSNHSHDRSADDLHAMHDASHPRGAAAGHMSGGTPGTTHSRSMAAFPPSANGSSEPFHSASSDQSSVTRSESRATVSIRWVVPKVVSLGADVACQLVVENHAGQPAHSVVVEVQLPPLTETTGQCRPQPHRDGDVLTWDLDTLEAGGTRVIDVGLRCKQRGRLAPAAAVTFSQATAAELEIVEPRIEIALDGPEQVVIDQPAVFSLAITNSGTGAVPNVAIDLTHSAGLTHGGGEELHYLIGTVGPGETRNIQFPLTGADEGSFEIACTAGTGGMQVATAHKPVAVVRPRLEVALEGPRLRYVDRKAAYHITVRNPGPAPVNNVQIVESVPEGFQFAECTTGGSYDSATRQVAWFVGRLEPQQDATVAVQLTATETGEHRLGTVVRADAGVVGNAETTTAVEGVASVVLDVTDDDDPVEVEGQTAYRIEVTNRGSRAARQVQVAAEVPDEMEVVRLEGPATGTTQGRQVVFPAIAELEPGASATYRVWVTCRSAGQARFRAYFRSEENTSPVLEEEPTRIYAD